MISRENFSSEQENAFVYMTKFVRSLDRQMLLQGYAGTGKCVDANSIVWTASGLRRISSYSNSSHLHDTSIDIDVNLIAFDKINNVLVEDTAKFLWRDSCTEGMRIELHGGYGISTSLSHPLWSEVNGEIRYRTASEIHTAKNNGDIVYLPLKIGHTHWDVENIIIKSMPIYYRGRVCDSIDIELDESLAYVLGLLVGDGSLKQNNPSLVGFTTADVELIDSICAFIKARNWEFTVKHYGKYDYRIICRPLGNLIRYLKLNTLSIDKKIPNEIIESPHNVICAFIRGLFDTDGSIDKRGVLQYSSSSKLLAIDVHNILLALGIKSSLRVKTTTHNDSFNIEFSGSSLDNFFNVIKFGLARKQSILEKFVGKNRNTNWKWYPPSISNLMERIFKTRNERDVIIDLSQPKYKRYKNPKPSSYWVDYYQGRRIPSHTKIKEFVDEFKPNELDDIWNYMITDDIIWLPVTEVNNCEVSLYDFTVPNNQSFIANGLINHNTTLMHEFVNYLENETNYAVVCTAPTNEAVRVMSKTTGRPYNQTIYSLLGLALVHQDDKKPVLKPQGTPKLKDYDVIIIDEASMIDTELFELIQEQLNKFTFIKVIYVGDEAQLPPVKDEGNCSKVFSIENKVILTEVQRTARDNPIISTVTKIRNNLNSELDVFERETITDDNGHGIEFWDDRDALLNELYEDFKSDAYNNNNNYVRAILYTNKAVDALNTHIRRQIFGKKDVAQYEVGENLIVDQPIVKNMGKYSKIIYTVGERLRVKRTELCTDAETGIEYWNLRVVNYEASSQDRYAGYIKVVDKDSQWKYDLAARDLALACKQKIQNGYNKRDAWKAYFQFKEEWSWVKYSYATTVHKCLPNNTLIGTEYGMRELKDIKIGDLVYAPSGKLRKVLNTVNTGNKKISKITLHSKQVLQSSSEHRWLVCDVNGPKYIEANKIEKGMYLRMSGVNISSHNTEISSDIFPDSIRTDRSLLPTEISNDLGWLIGALIGDGCYSYKTNRIDFTNPSSITLLNEYANIIKSYGINPIYINRHGRLYTICVDSLALRSLISYLGLGRETAGDKSIPSIFKSQSMEVRANLIAGLFDTDGSISKQRRTIRYGSKSFTLLSDIQLMLLTLGIYSTISYQDSEYGFLSIASNHISLFKKTIPLKHPDKISILNSYSDDAVKEESDIIPHGYNMAQMMISAYKEKYPNTRGIKGIGFNSALNRSLKTALDKVLLNQRMLSRTLLKRMLKFSIDNDLADCVARFSSEIDGGRWVYIEDVSHTNEMAEMIDIEVEVEHAFISEGYVTHNSQGSTFERVYVIERDLNKLTWNNEERNKLKYVAFTRPSTLLRILQ